MADAGLSKSDNSDSGVGAPTAAAADAMVEVGSYFGVDFGGTLTKFVCFEPQVVPDALKPVLGMLTSDVKYGQTGERDPGLSFYSKKLGGRFHFVMFHTSRTQGAIDMLMSLEGGSHGISALHATGGGAYKYADMFEQKAGIRFLKHDELEMVVTGIVFALLQNPLRECYSFAEPPLGGSKERPTIARENSFQFKNEMDIAMERVSRPLGNGLTLDEMKKKVFPFLVVNMGSGISVIKVESHNKFKRVSGTALGGGTYFGLCKLLTSCTTFEDAMNMAQHGDSRKVNLLVSDIYGGSYAKVGLPGEMTASFFGKAAATHGLSRPASVQTERNREAVNRFVPDEEQRKRLERRERYKRSQSTILPSSPPKGKGKSIAKDDAGTPPDPPSQRRGRTESAESTPASIFDDADISRALVVMIAQNATQIALMCALLHNANRIVFTGNFLRHNKIAMLTLTHNLRVWSKGKIEPLFMEHEGHFGAMGALLYALGLDAMGDIGTYSDGSDSDEAEKPPNSPSSSKGVSVGSASPGSPQHSPSSLRKRSSSFCLDESSQLDLGGSRK